MFVAGVIILLKTSLSQLTSTKKGVYPLNIRAYIKQIHSGVLSANNATSRCPLPIFNFDIQCIYSPIYCARVLESKA